MEPRETPVPERIAGARGGRRSATTTFILIAVLLAGAIAKPWDQPGSEAPRPVGVAVPSPSSSPLHARATPRPTPAPPSADDRLAEVCLEPSGWRILATEVWRDQVVRSWRAVEPAVAAGPLDPAVTFTPIVAQLVPILGFCAPISGPDQPPKDARGSVQVIEPGGDVTELYLERSVPPADVSGGARWVGPADGAPAFGAPGGKPGRTWPVGRYVIRVATPDGRYERWIGVEILRPFLERR